jgi:drug/metabolite transporter (DMT)-like permease
MSNLMLYLVAVVIWGSTWLAIKFQLGAVASSVSVASRFGSAALVLFLYAAWQRSPLRLPARLHAWLALQGLLLFGVNYVCVYLSEVHLPSGIVAVIFSVAVFFNLLGARLWFGTPIPPRALLGALLGCTGVALVFSPQLLALSATPEAAVGAALALFSAFSASLGNLVASRNQQAGGSVVTNTAWSMLYGAALVLAYAIASGERLDFVWTVPYVASFLYLTLFGSVIAFTAYLTLIRRVGPGKAGYVNVAVPVVALLLSTLFERLDWQPLMLVGAVLCLAGNILVLRSRRPAG